MKLSSQSSLFAVQTMFSLIGVGFSVGMLVAGNDASIYLPILTGIIGYWVPSPGSNFKSKQSSNGVQTTQTFDGVSTALNPKALTQQAVEQILVG